MPQPLPVSKATVYNTLVDAPKNKRQHDYVKYSSPSMMTI
jgi:hypothetical protein